MAQNQPEQVPVITSLIPLCPRTAMHPLFRQRRDVVQERVSAAVVRELSLIVAANQMEDQDVWGHHVDESLRSEDSGVSQDQGDGAAAAVDEPSSPPQHQDDLTRTEELSRSGSGDKQGEGEIPVEERDFITGIRISSSPLPGLLSSNHGGVSRTGDACGYMSIEQQMALDNISSDSSSLPAFPLPQPATQSCPSPSVTPSVSRPNSPPQHVIPSTVSSPASFVMSSASRNVPSRSRFEPPFPPPLANVSASQIDTISSSSSDPSVDTVDSQRDAILAARALLRLSRQSRLRQLRVQRRESRLRRFRIRRVARWLLSQSNDSGANASSGSPLNPIVLSSDSESEGLS